MESISLNSLHPHEKTEKQKKLKKEKVKSNTTYTNLTGKFTVLYQHYYVSLLWLCLKHSMLS